MARKEVFPVASRPDTTERRAEVRVQTLPHGADLPLPAYQTPQAAGLDLLAAVGEYAPVHLARGARVLIPTSIAIALPPGFEAQVRPRSGPCTTARLATLPPRSFLRRHELVQF